MSRPKKTKKIVKLLPPDGESGGSLFGDSIRRHADPHDDEGFMLGGLFDLIASEEPSKETLSQNGAWLIRLIRSLGVDDCKKMFASIIRAKESLDESPPRESNILRACAEFIKDAGRPPTKSELTDYVLSWPEKFKGMPAKIDGKAWNRLREKVGLDGLD